MSLKQSLSYITFLSLIFSTGCGSYSEFSSEATKDYSRAEMQKFAKYMVAGKQLYTTHCSNCHQESGQGLGKLYPPLAKSDFMMQNVNRTACLIKNGIKGEIIVNNITYNQEMPALEELTNLEVAEIATYIYNSWGNERGFVTVKEVETSLSNCQ
ncbi:c-type cytochrome [Marivirga lumbricoides]